jgi:predicted MFS family arabinose efflux permease
VWFGVIGVNDGARSGDGYASSAHGRRPRFSIATVTAILVAIGTSTCSSGLAALLERRFAATVLRAGPLVQAVLAVVIASSVALAPFAVAASVFVAVMLFTHTFAFGALARLDVTGRVVAATPAMVMVGSAIGPVLGGTLVKQAGYGAIVAVAIDAIAIACFAARAR